MIHEENYVVTTFQVDMNNRVTPAAICGMMQECASIYCLNAGIGIEDLKKKGLTWMLLKQYVRFDSFPSWNSALNVKTWPRSITGLRALRDYEVTDSDGGSAAKSVTNWVLIDIKTRRPVMLDETIKHLTAVDKAALGRDFRIRVEKISGTCYSAVYSVKYSDIDINMHVNNMSYIKWCLDTVPFSFQKDNILKELSIEYIDEIDREVDVKAEVCMNSFDVYHELKRSDTGDVVCRAQTAWQAQR